MDNPSVRLFYKAGTRGLLFKEFFKHLRNSLSNNPNERD